MKKINIAVDTSILRKDRGFLNSDILLIKKLAKLDLIQIHIPWIVYKESTSQNKSDVDKAIESAIGDVSYLNKKGLGNTEHQKLKTIAEDLEKIKSEVSKSVEKHWKEFIVDSKAILHEQDKDHGEKVMSSYFLGSDPFPTPKSRKDIPDAFIYENILSIKEKFGKVIFICEDNNLRVTIAKNDDCSGFKSFEDFFDSSLYKPIDKQYKKIEHFADELIILKDNTDKLEEYAREELYMDLFAGDAQVIKHHHIPSDSHEGALQSIDNDKVETIQTNKIQFVDGIFYIPVEMTAKFRIEYFLFKADYYIYEESRDIKVTDRDWNKHYFLVEEWFDVNLSFKCTIEQESLQFEAFEFEFEPAIIEELKIIRK